MTDKTKIAVAVFDKCAALYQDRFMDVSLYHDTFDRFCSEIKKENAAVLELACGPGNITKYLLQQRSDFKILGTDLAPKMLALAQENNPTAQFQLLDVKAIGANTLKTTYDGVMCGFGLPYLSQEEAIRFIHQAYGILNTDGLLYLSTMEDDYSRSGWQKGSTGDAIFMHYHQEDYLSTALTAAGFSILLTERIVYPATDGSPITDLILIAKK
ncbi:class I SAM-dependent DNA methyltransferase [Flavobacterium phycosphaerae]|uniref:class I SAM-dependent DNA methyltransferase n=1 Tax=Flavobacterium phycosphaerae TaxID=2697515 RepID=UPI00138AB7A9|nr:class I SAM-dependent methyltransferase [Flavobacterium phycosphaerae]